MYMSRNKYILFALLLSLSAGAFAQKPSVIISVKAIVCLKTVFLWMLKLITVKH